ncbi:MAG: TlpA disulfide reductase family protein [Gammaproteobacteria bacterium]
MKSRYLAYVLLFIGGMWGGNELVKLFSNEEEITAAANAQMNRQVTNFTLNDMEGNQHQFSEWDGKVRVLNFWATWCPPCRKETPMFVEMQDELGDKGLQFVGVAIDEKQKV